MKGERYKMVVNVYFRKVSGYVVPSRSAPGGR